MGFGNKKRNVYPHYVYPAAAAAAAYHPSQVNVFICISLGQSVSVWES